MASRFGGRYKPNRAEAKEFAILMEKTCEFCDEHGISHSSSMDSFYFSVNGKNYRVSNHSIEASNRGAYVNGVQVRDKYHFDERGADTVYIHASKTRIREIYEAIVSGASVDGRGNVIEIRR